MDRSLIVSAAEKWIGTPYHHNARLLGVGVDCAQLLAAVYEEAGVIGHVSPRYAHDWHLHNSGEQFIDWVLRCGGREIEEVSSLPGDLVLWRWGRTFSHGGILIGGGNVVHAWLELGVTVDDMSTHTELSTRPRRFFTMGEN
jgi:cell wall-associated NlpC family hydrolase